MNRRALLGLIAVAVTLLGLLWMARLQDPAPPGVGAPLLAQLGESAGRVSVVRITLPGDRVLVTLEQRGEQWVAAELDDWPAATQRLRTLVLALAEARRVEQMTGNPEAWHRLGLQDIASAEADGVAVTIEYNGARDTVLVGHTGLLDGAHSYARLSGEDEAWTVNRNLAVPRSLADWIRRELTDVPATRVLRVEIAHEDGERVTVTQSPPGSGRFDVADRPEDSELLHDTAAAGVGAALAGLLLENLSRAAGEPPENATRAVLLTHDGLTLTVHAWQLDGRRLAAFEASVDRDRVEAQLRATLPPQDVPADDGPPAPAADGAPLDPDRLQAALAERQAEADALNRRLHGWHFELPAHRHAQLTRRMQDLLAD